MFVWMGDDPWGEGAKDILPVPVTPDNLNENPVSVERVKTTLVLRRAKISTLDMLRMHETKTSVDVHVECTSLEWRR